MVPTETFCKCVARLGYGLEGILQGSLQLVPHLHVSVPEDPFAVGPAVREEHGIEAAGVIGVRIVWGL